MIRPIYRLPALPLVAAGALAAQPVYAHGFGERYDLPVPLEYYLLGAAATVALSFVVIGVFGERRAGAVWVLALQPLWPSPACDAAPEPRLHHRSAGVRGLSLPAGDRCWHPGRSVAQRQLRPHLRVGHLVGGSGLFRGPCGQPVGVDEPLEHPLWLGGGPEQAIQVGVRPESGF